jgi:hypothetical protein
MSYILVTSFNQQFVPRKEQHNMPRTRKIDGRGRPPVYTGKVKRHIVTLIRHYGLTGARTILNAERSDTRRTLRNLNVVPKALGISMPTLGKFAQEAGIALERGRPAA